MRAAPLPVAPDRRRRARVHPSERNRRFEAAQRRLAEAAAHGAVVVNSELVGLMPAGAAAAAAGAALRIEGFEPSRVLELRLLED